MFKSENSKIRHNLFVYSPRVGKREAPKSSKTYMGTKTGYKKQQQIIITIWNQGYTPPKEGYKIKNNGNMGTPLQRKDIKCSCVIEEVEQVTYNGCFHYPPWGSELIHCPKDINKCIHVWKEKWLNGCHYTRCWKINKYIKQ